MWRTDSLWVETAIVLGIAVALAITLSLSSTIGRGWGLGWLLIPLAAAAFIHLHWLPRHGVNGWTGEPRDRYLELIAARKRRRQGPR